MKLHTIVLITLLMGTAAVHAEEAGTAATNIAIIRTQHDLLKRADWRTTLNYFH